MRVYASIKCPTKNCNNNSRKRKPFCCKCWAKIDKGLDPTKKNKCSGARNVNWKGGIFQYPNHALMKRNRLLKLKECNYICQQCFKNRATEIHHKDFSKDNHSLDNLIPMCRPCHGLNRSNSLIKIYGRSMKQIQQELNIPLSAVYTLHYRSKLKKILNLTQK